MTARKKVENKNKKNVKINRTSNITDFSDDEDSLEQNFDHVFSDLNPVPRRKKSSSATKIKNGKPPKKPRTPSKLRLQ